MLDRLSHILFSFYRFQNDLDSGLIDIISPPASFYPDFEKLSPTLSDPIDRVRWRSKQSLDFAFLMMYSYPKGMFYIQLEDDILAKKNYLSIMKDTALTRIANKQPWFVLDFCQLGFIGECEPKCHFLVFLLCSCNAY